MPEMDGISFLRAIREKEIPTPMILFISGHNELTSEGAYELGATGLLSKPFSSKQLKEKIQESLQEIGGKLRPPRHRLDVRLGLGVGVLFFL